MSYFVNKTDGTAIVVLDGTKDTTSTSITLFGRLVQNYGDQTNENFVHLLENFALSTSPANPIVGQLWYDASVNNIKALNGSVWITVGSSIVGNVTLSGNLFVGPNGFRIQDLGDVTISNNVSGGDISVYANIAGTNTRTLYINGGTGLLEVNANAIANMGVTTKIYVDSEIIRASSNSDVNLLANVVIINANLVARINEENQLRANITAANVQIALRDTISRVNSINSATDSALTANVAIINANLVQRISQTVAVENAMLANVAALRANITAANAAIVTLDNRLNSVNTAIEISVAANLATKADTVSPTLTGTPLAPTAAFGANTTQVATTQYVMTRSAYWDGSRKYVSTADPATIDGANGDIWFKYTP
jgi:hypothetical protein